MLNYSSYLMGVPLLIDAEDFVPYHIRKKIDIPTATSAAKWTLTYHLGSSTQKICHIESTWDEIYSRFFIKLLPDLPYLDELMSTFKPDFFLASYPHGKIYVLPGHNLQVQRDGMVTYVAKPEHKHSYGCYRKLEEQNFSHLASVLTWKKIQYNDHSWVSESQCLSSDSDIFFCDDLDAKIQALTLCSSCPVMEKCAAFSLRKHEKGIWGGLGYEAREKLFKKLRPIPRTTVLDDVRSLLQASCETEKCSS